MISTRYCEDLRQLAIEADILVRLIQLERPILGRTQKTLIIVAGVLGATALGLLVFRAYCQHRLAQQLAINTVRGIAEEGFVDIGGIRQWVQIRGADRRNPVLLIVHGGPGVSLMAYTPLYRAWERNFTVVQWDQRGDGKTFGGNTRPSFDDMKIVRIAQDGIEVTNYLRKRLHTDKIVLLGHSWGGAVALTMVQSRPELFSAFVGTGFIVSERADWKSGFGALLERARQDHNARAVTELESIGPPPYARPGAARIRARWLDTYDHRAERRLVRRAWRMALFAPNYSIRDIWEFFAAMRFSESTAGKWLYGFDARQLSHHLDVPILLIEGDRDFTTPIPIVKQYFDALAAPRKEFYIIPGAGHSALITDPGVIGRILDDRLRWRLQ